jgi:hypothetical protein
MNIVTMNRTSLSLMLVTLVALTLTTAAWARKYILTVSTAVPAARGELDVKTDKNGNTLIDLKVENLAKPSNLTPPATAYVVWIQQRGSEPQNAGELNVGNNLKAELKTVTALKSFDLFATAESDQLAKAPTGQQIFHATVQE